MFQQLLPFQLQLHFCHDPFEAFVAKMTLKTKSLEYHESYQRKKEPHQFHGTNKIKC